jgi:N-acetyl-anhydromuramyl-L-alanine amidase AmpD
VLAEKVPDEELDKFQGLVGHYHLTTNKTDPGPAFDWEKLLSETKRLTNAVAPASEKSP